jgi:hypothetical protein
MPLPLPTSDEFAVLIRSDGTRARLAIARLPCLRRCEEEV